MAFPDDATTEYEQSASQQAERILAGAAIEACRLCNTDGYRGHRICDHIDRAPIYRRGMQLVREALDRTKPDP